MFYSQIILAKKGPLGMIWLASHWLEKLKKNQIFATDIETSVQSIATPVVPLALRVSGHLLLGVVRIYDRKVKYLFVDCNDAVSKIKLAFSGDIVDLPEKAFESTALNVADFGSFEEDEYDESTKIDQWASLALNQSNRQISNDIDVKTPKGVRSIIDDGAKENTNFRQTNRKWLAFDDGLDEFDEPEVLRNAPTDSKEEDVLDQSMDDPETLRKGVAADQSNRVSLEQNNDMMAPYEDDDMPPMDMDDSMDDLGRFSAGSNLSPAPVDGFQDEEEEEEEVNTASLKKARRRKRRKLCDIDSATKLSASSRKRRAATFQRTTETALLRRRLDPIWGEKSCVVQISRPMCSLARAPALQRLISAACAKAVVSSQTKNVQDDEVEQKEEEEEEVDEVPFLNDDDDDDAFPPMDDYDDGFRQSSLSSINTPLKQTANSSSEENMSSFGGIQLHERTKRVIEDLHPELIEKGSIEDFRNTLRPGASRKEAAAGFFELLVLATKHNLVGLNQQDAYGPIRVTPTEKLKSIPAM